MNFMSQPQTDIQTDRGTDREEKQKVQQVKDKNTGGRVARQTDVQTNRKTGRQKLTSYTGASVPRKTISKLR